MTLLDGDRERLKDYIRTLADQMGLYDWALRLGDDPPNIEGAAASNYTVYGRQYATIRFDDEWFDYEPDELRTYVVHELVHCHTAKMCWAFDNVKDVLGEGSLYRLANMAFTDAHEMTVDAIATAWAKTLPLPE